MIKNLILLMHPLLKRIFLVFIVFFSLGITANASSDRWVPIYDMVYVPWNNTNPYVNRQVAAKRFVDKQTAAYDDKTNRIIYWSKSISSGNNGWVAKNEVDLNTLDYRVLERATLRNGHIYSSKKYAERIIFFIESSDEFEVKTICDYLNIANSFKSTPHQWKYLLSRYRSYLEKPGTIYNPLIDWYICRDLYVKNYRPGITKVFVKHVQARQKNKGYIPNLGEPYLVDFNKHSVYSQILSPKEDNIVPESLEEAIYNETLNIISRKT